MKGPWGERRCRRKKAQEEEVEEVRLALTTNQC